MYATTTHWSLPSEGRYEVEAAAPQWKYVDDERAGPTDYLRLVLLHHPGGAPEADYLRLLLQPGEPLVDGWRMLALDVPTRLVYRMDRGERQFQARVTIDHSRRCLSVPGADCVPLERFGITEERPWIAAAVGGGVSTADGPKVDYRLSLLPAGLGCGASQIAGAQETCQGVCASLGRACLRSSGVHECRAFEGGGCVASCALECMAGVDCAIEVSPSMRVSYDAR